MRAAGLSEADAQLHDIDGEQVIAMPVDVDGQQIWRLARAVLPGHYPVLVLDEISDALDRMYFEHGRTRSGPSDVLARSVTVDVDARVAEISAQWVQSDPGTGDEGYYLDSYDIAHFGRPRYLVIVPRPEPWAAFAYVNSVFSVGGYEPELLVAAARRWHERYGAEPTVVGIATGFMVSRPPADLVDAERLAAEHQFFAGLTAGTTVRAYARALLQLDRWALYDRP